MKYLLICLFIYLFTLTLITVLWASLNENYVLYSLRLMYIYIRHLQMWPISDSVLCRHKGFCLTGNCLCRLNWFYLANGVLCRCNGWFL